MYLHIIFKKSGCFPTCCAPSTIHAHCWRCRSCGGGPLAANTRHRVFWLAKTKPTKPALDCRWMDGCGPYVAGSNKPLLLGSWPSPTTGNQREFGPQWYICITYMTDRSYMCVYFEYCTYTMRKWKESERNLHTIESKQTYDVLVQTLIFMNVLFFGCILVPPRLEDANQEQTLIKKRTDRYWTVGGTGFWIVIDHRSGLLKNKALEW